jgi:succinate-semialdehyde dehydrogenase/glutarate-semialdehyde dehydrogenase
MILFEATEEAMIAANSLPYGLAAYVFTGSHRTAAEVSANLKAGVVAINGATATAPEAPFGGIGDSGIGRESGAEGLIEYTNIKTITETFV